MGLQVPLFHDTLEIEVGVDTVIGHAVLREIVGPDPLVSVTGADLVAADTLLLVLALRFIEFVQSTPEDPHGTRTVLVLQTILPGWRPPIR